MKTNVALLVAFCLLAGTTMAQTGKTGSHTTAKPAEKPAEENTIDNFVTNGDFENFNFKSLKNPGQLPELCPGWMAATQANPDLFAKGVKSVKVAAPQNECGFQEPSSGSAYAGFVAYSKDVKKSRTYIQTKLTKILQKDVLYCVKMQISLGDLSKFATNNIGLYFSDRKIVQPNSGSLVYDPQIKVKNNAVISTMDSWETICTTFLGTGKEEYLIIGCFGTDDQVTVDKTRKPASIIGTQIYDAYYFVDDIQIVPIEAPSECFCGSPADLEPDMIYGGSSAVTPSMKPAEAVAATGVYFAYLDDEINTMFIDGLDNLVGILRANPSYKLEIAGHADTDEVNEAKVNGRYSGLAQRRADAVKAYFVGKGIPETRFTVLSKENTEPASTRPTPLSHAQNRRVVFVLK